MGATEQHIQTITLPRRRKHKNMLLTLFTESKAEAAAYLDSMVPWW
jgi:hypothetical protein